MAATATMRSLAEHFAKRPRRSSSETEGSEAAAAAETSAAAPPPEVAAAVVGGGAGGPSLPRGSASALEIAACAWSCGRCTFRHCTAASIRYLACEVCGLER